MGKHEVIPMNKGIFLDRDGVINDLVLNPTTGEFEPPHNPEDLVISPDVILSLKILQDRGFQLFLVSNQPDYAKGKTTLENLKAVHRKLDTIFTSETIQFREYYYCYHHPHGIVPSHSYDCECRKPKPFFFRKAACDYHIHLNSSWMIGDRDSDIACGKAAGTRTILIKNPYSSRYHGLSEPDFFAANLKEAVHLIIRNPNLWI